MKRSCLIVLAVFSAASLEVAGAALIDASPRPSPRTLTLGSIPDPTGGRFAGRGGVWVALEGPSLAGLREGHYGRWRLPLPGGGSADLDLERFEVLAPGATVTVTGEDGPRPIDPDITLLRGSIAADPGSWAVFGVAADQVTGVLEVRGRRFEIGPARAHAGAAHAMPHVVAAPEDAPHDPAFSCGADALEAAAEREGDVRASARAPFTPLATPTRLECRMAIDGDWEFYANKFGSNATAATQYVITVMGVVSAIYERDLNVTLTIPYLNLWATPSDPYTEGTLGGSLPEFASYWNANRGDVERDLAHLVSGRSLGGGIAYLTVLCNLETGYALSALEATYLYPTATTTWDATVLAHEIGHNFGSPHTQSCFWQANGYAPSGALLDSCFTPEGHCYAGGTGQLPQGGGTIMSYCHLVAGIANGVRLVFHPACIAATRAHAEDCLDAAPIQPPRALAAATSPWAVNLSWAPGGSPGLIRYDVWRSAYPLDPAPASIGSTTDTTFQDTNRLGASWYRVTAVTVSGTSAYSGELRVDLCRPTGPGSITSGAATRAPLAADFDEDGILDLAALNANTSGTVSVMLGRGAGGIGDGTYDPPVAYACGQSPTDLAAADLDEDGILDLVTTHGALVGRVSVLHGQGAGGVGDGTFAPAVDDTVGTQPQALLAADFDEDGALDLAVANRGSNSVSVLLARATNGVSEGTFLDPVDYPVGAQPYGLDAADHDADGVLDLAVACRSSGTVVLLRGLGSGGAGNGTFVAAGTYAVGAAATALAHADFDGDGLLDLAVARQVSGGVVVVLRGTGGGAFTSAGSFPCGSSPVAVRACDLNGNGIPDLVVANAGGAGLCSVLLGAGDGTIDFQQAQSFAVGSDAAGVIVADLNEDGALDLVTAVPGSVTALMALLGQCGPTGPATLALHAPNGGEEWPVRAERVVTWSRGPGIGPVDVEVTRDGGGHWERIASGVTGTSFAWTVTPPVAPSVRLRVVDACAPQRLDLSNAPFAVVAPVTAAGAGRPAFALRALRGELRFAVTLPDAAPARLELLDVAGRRVASRALAPLGAGSHVVAFEARTLPIGVYLARLTHGADRVTVKTVVAR